jgi:ABC-2 type transport system ATP-binding protein
MEFSIYTEKLTKTFGKTTALDEVSFGVPEGAIYSLVGANGAGKTTLMKILMNMHRPTAGSAHVKGVETQELKGKSFNRIGYVSENMELPQWMTVEVMFNYLRPFYPQWDRELEAELVRKFDLPLKQKLKNLSRGNRMKAACASALAYRPDVIVLDEPFSGLDPLVRDELIDGLVGLASGTTIFLSSHDLAEVESFSSHIGYLEKGRMLFSEGLPVLQERFREVTVTLGQPAVLPAGMPADWLQPEVAGGGVRFIHSQFKGDDSRVEIAALFPGASEISPEPMDLRAIFVAIARDGKRAAAARGEVGA